MGAGVAARESSGGRLGAHVFFYEMGVVRLERVVDSSSGAAAALEEETMVWIEESEGF